MGWEDRPYYRDRGRSVMSPLRWLVSGSMPLFTVFGIRVRAHASLVLFIALTILLSGASGYAIGARAVSMAALFTIVVLHEFGHCFMARFLGGRGDDVLLWPLGGLASADPPHRPLPVFLTVAAGPAVNLLICVVCAGIIHILTAGYWVRLNPLNAMPIGIEGWNTAIPYLYWVYFVSYAMLLFNLLPIFPLDGGQMVQSILWPIVGYMRSMIIATTTGMVGSVALGLFGIYEKFSLFLILLAACLFYACYQQRQALREVAADDWSDGSTYSPSFYVPPETPRRRKVNRRAIKRARKSPARKPPNARKSTPFSPRSPPTACIASTGSSAAPSAKPPSANAATPLKCPATCKTASPPL